jgi:multidrug efflux pump subunit AcrA (membrane-fusion protein)
MTAKRILVSSGFLALVALLLLAGCGGGEATETVPADAVPVVPQDAEGKVVAEAVIEPVYWSELRFESGGTVVQVLVEEGDIVSEGDLLVQLDVTDAELGVLEAEAALALAEAQLAQVQAGPRQQEIAAAQARLAAAEAALAQAAAQQDELAAGAIDAQIAATRAEIASARITVRQAEEEHDDTMDCYEVRAENGEKERVCPLLGPTEERARLALEAATDALAVAQTQLAALQSGVEPQLRAAQAGVESASAQRDAAQARLDLVEAGSTPEEIASAEAQVAQAKVAVAAAESALERFELRAPSAGTVTKVYVDVGETAAPEEVVVVLASLDQLQARTTDLTELDIARVVEGQSVAVTLDALPGEEFRGQVARIGEQSVDYRGDVTYPVFVALDGDTTSLRWGMTALVEIDTE